MCEIFGACLKRPLVLNNYLKEFYSHSPHHPNGWGLALLHGNEAEIEKEPVRADRSHYLRRRLSVPVEEQNVLAHIRYATIGNEEYENCHPFTGTDISGRRWTLIHNGTIFDYEPLNPYSRVQRGQTDSERILLYIIDRMNRRIRESADQHPRGETPDEDSKCPQGAAHQSGGNRMQAESNEQTACRARVHMLSAGERFAILDSIVCSMSKGNKLNLILYDGEYMYVHANYPESLYYLKSGDGYLFSTQPLSGKNLSLGTPADLSLDQWKLFPMTTLYGFHDGEQIFRGTDHGSIYVVNEEDMRMLYLAFSSL